jgi:hypothetical protein
MSSKAVEFFVNFRFFIGGRAVEVVGVIVSCSF